ncbi:MAG: VWA domain-containing protein [Deltaproteobacteria bacterium]|nr:VWA domain-containing protein [Deltaproteobacteria bacterium]
MSLRTLPLPSLGLFALAACGSDELIYSRADDASGAPAREAPADAMASPADDPATTTNQGGGNPELTAGVWDDNRNFDEFTRYLAELAQLDGAPRLSLEERTSARSRHENSPKTALDVALVIDTTGSMGDELAYLTGELGTISRRIHDTFPDATQRYALVVYKDVGDEYVTRSFDFVNDVDALTDTLEAQSASGGGDYPEAPEQALAAVNQLSFRRGDVARIAFWIADAPHHLERADQLTEAIRNANDGDVHLYPIAASGTDDLTELSMRSAAQLTGGRYLFLTDDSGIGNDHKEPRIPCYFVTTLSNAMVRMTQIELSGVYAEPPAGEVIRTGGDPQDGRCASEAGQTFWVF